MIGLIFLTPIIAVIILGALDLYFKKDFDDWEI
jgi:hypothetical protein